MKPRSKKALVIASVIILILLFIVVQIDDFIYYFDDTLLPVSTDNIPHSGGFGRPFQWRLLSTTVIHVRFVEIKRHISKHQRAEYVFEIIEWLNNYDGADTNVKRISLYSQAFTRKYKSNHEIFAINYGYKYEPGKEYLIFLYRGGLDYAYIPLDDISKSNYFEDLEELGVTADMNSTQVISKLKQSMEDEILYFEQNGLIPPWQELD